MGYGLQLGGELPDQASEQKLVDALNALTADAANGVTYGTGSFQFLGSVAFDLPTSATVDWAESIATLETAAQALSDPPTQAQLDAIGAATAALQAKLTPPAAAPVAGADGVPVAQPTATPGAGGLDPARPNATDAVAAAATALPAEEQVPLPTQQAAGFALPVEATPEAPVATAQPAT